MTNRRSVIRQWTRAAAVSVPLLAAQALVPAVLEPVMGKSVLAVVHAQQNEAQPQPKDQPTRRTPALRNAVFEKLSEAQALSEEKKYSEALKILDEQRTKTGAAALNSYELANLYNLYAFIYYSQEQYDKALEAYNKVIEQPDIPVALEVNTRYTVAQLYFVMEQWKRGLDELQKWMGMVDNPGANAYVLMAQGYYQLEDYDKALSNVERAISMFRQEGKVPREQWLTLARFLYYEKGNIDKAIAVLEELVTHYPKKDYWVQLSYMYGEKKQDKKQLAAMETAYVQGMLEQERELLNLAYLFLANDVPYKAGKVVDKGIKEKKIEATAKNLELLANAWRAAQEIKWSIPVMEQAAQKADDGDLYARLGNIYVDGEEYKKAIDAINAGFQKGGVKRPDTANLVLGMAYFNTDQYDKARKAFDAAKKDKRSKDYAEQWLQYMESELERQRSLRDV